MCGRFALNLTPDEVVTLFKVAEIAPFPPRFNIPPTEPILMVMRDIPRPSGSNMPPNAAILVRWGFIPSWVKDLKAFPLLINARSETAAEKNTFRAALRHRRTLVPASGFYEWRRDGGKKTTPYWVRRRDGRPMAFAGLIETYLSPNGSEVDTGAIMTTAATGAIASIHDRAPVVVEPESFERWLNCRAFEPREIVDLLRPAHPDFFEAVPVSDKVNKVANNGPELQQPIAASVTSSQPKGEDFSAQSAQLRLL